MPVISIPKALRDRPQLTEPPFRQYGNSAIRHYGYDSNPWFDRIFYSTVGKGGRQTDDAGHYDG
jgi:hypothetical protein